MKSRKAYRYLIKLVQLALVWSLSCAASAEIIDNISLKVDANSELDATIKFSVPIQYLRHFPQQKSQNLVIYFSIPGIVPRDQWLNVESNRSAISKTVRSFRITTRDLSSGPRIEIEFHQPVEYSVTSGKDNQSILVHIKPAVAPQPKDSPSDSLSPRGAAGPVAPIIMPVTTATAAVAGAATTVTDKSVPTPPPLPTQTAPSNPPLATKQLAPIESPAQLGGKDGLPFFPRIDPFKVIPSAQPGEVLSVDEQVRRSNNQAADLMSKARDSLLRGELFAAIDALNAVLNLPSNKYSADAQLWIGIAKERSGQPAKAKLEYESYLRLYPNGTETNWVSTRLTKLNVLAPPTVAKVKPRPQPTKFEVSEYGSLSMYYYTGKSWINTQKTLADGSVVPDNSSKKDQSSFIASLSMTARAYNNEFDNRLVFQDFFSANLLHGQQNRNRPNAYYYDVRNRIDNYSVRLGQQSAMGGGVLGRFFGAAAGYGFVQDWRANVAVGRLTDVSLDSKPRFYSLGLDFGVNSPLGGSAYYINQHTLGITDRKAVGGNLRYFEQGKTLIAMTDYDLQFKELNMFTLQGTLNRDSGTDFNFMLDRRKTPSLSAMNAVYGAPVITAGQHCYDPNTGLQVSDAECIIDQASTTPVYTKILNVEYKPTTIALLLDSGYTTADIITLAKQRTAVSNSAQIGVSQRINEKWQSGADFMITNTSGTPASGSQTTYVVTDPITNVQTTLTTTGPEGYLAGTPGSGNSMTLSGRLSASNLIAKRDLSTFSLSYTKSPNSNSQFFYLNNRTFSSELWTFDSTLRLILQRMHYLDSASNTFTSKQTMLSPVFRASYLMRSNLTLEGEIGGDYAWLRYSSLQPSNNKRLYLSSGFRWDF